MLARDTRDYVVDDAPMPWALQIFYDCTTFGQFPRVGGWHSQDDDEMYLMQLANRSAVAYASAAAGREISESDAEFFVWVENDDE